MAKKEAREENRADWKKQSARDFIALGSIPFYALVVARVAMLQNWNYVFQFVFAGIIFFILLLIFRLGLQSLYSGLGFILLVLVSLYYKNLFFAIFALIIYILLIVSLFYLKVEKAKIWKGIFAGAISTAAGYFAANWVF